MKDGLSQIAKSPKFGAEGRSGAPAADPTPLGSETDQLIALEVSRAD